MNGRAAVLAAAAGTLLGGCSLQIPFDAWWSLHLTAPPGAFDAELPMDLSEQELWAERDRVDELVPESMTLRVVEIGPGNVAPSARIDLRCRAASAAGADAAEIVLMEGIDLPIDDGATVQVPAADGFGAALRDALRGSGGFTLVVHGETDGPVHATVELAVVGTAVVSP